MLRLHGILLSFPSPETAARAMRARPMSLRSGGRVSPAEAMSPTAPPPAVLGPQVPNSYPPLEVWVRGAEVGVRSPLVAMLLFWGVGQVGRFALFLRNVLEDPNKLSLE